MKLENVMRHLSHRNKIARRGDFTYSLAMPTLHIIEGPVGAGKTTFANRLGSELGTAPLVLDVWMTNLFRVDRPDQDIWAWYAERKARCIAQILAISGAMLEHGHDAIVELGLIKIADRMALYQTLDAEGRDYTVHVLETPLEERKQRVKKRNTEQGETFAMHVSDEVFKMASHMWEPVSQLELHDRKRHFRFVVG